LVKRYWSHHIVSPFVGYSTRDGGERLCIAPSGKMCCNIPQDHKAPKAGKLSGIKDSLSVQEANHYIAYQHWHPVHMRMETLQMPLKSTNIDELVTEKYYANFLANWDFKDEQEGKLGVDELIEVIHAACEMGIDSLVQLGCIQLGALIMTLGEPAKVARTFNKKRDSQPSTVRQDGGKDEKQNLNLRLDSHSSETVEFIEQMMLYLAHNCRRKLQDRSKHILDSWDMAQQEGDSKIKDVETEGNDIIERVTTEFQVFHRL
jgi:hypothetical protein